MSDELWRQHSASNGVHRMQERRRRPHMRPEGASILSARCEIREIPLTVTSKTDSTAVSSAVLSPLWSLCLLCRAIVRARESCGPGSTCLRRVCGRVLVTRRPAFAAFRLPRFTRAIVPRGWRSFFILVRKMDSEWTNSQTLPCWQSQSYHRRRHDDRRNRPRPGILVV